MRGLYILKIGNGSSEMSEVVVSGLVTVVGFGDDLDSLSCLDSSGSTALVSDIFTKKNRCSRCIYLQLV